MNIGLRKKFLQSILNDIKALELGNGFETLEPSCELVSVIVPSYNHEKYVRESIISIINQSYKNIEIILIDDGSSDCTYEIATKILKEQARPYCAVRIENRGHVPNLNAGIQISYGGWLCFLASDDVFYPTKIENQLRVAHTENADIVLGLKDELTEDGCVIISDQLPVDIDAWDARKIKEQLIYGNIAFPYGGWFISKPVFSIIGFFNPKIYTEDFDFSLRITSTNLRIRYYLDQTIAGHRQSRPILSAQLLDKGKKSFIKCLLCHADNMKLLRSGLSRVYINSAFNKFSYGHLPSLTIDLFLGLVVAPISGIRYIIKRIYHKYRQA